MSTLDVIRGILGPARVALEPAKLYTQRTGPGSLDADDPTPPYWLVSPGPAPSKPNNLEEAEQFYLEGWGTQVQLDAGLEALEWLQGYRIGREGDCLRIRYGIVGKIVGVDPDARLSDGREIWRAQLTVRAFFVDRSMLLRPRVVEV